MSKSPTVSNEFKGSDWAREYFNGNKGDVTGQMYQLGQQYMNNPNSLVYQGQRVADWSPWQSQAMYNTQQIANGTQSSNMANDQLKNFIAGTSGVADPTVNPYSQMDNPELLNMISQSNADIADQYNRTTKQQTDAAAIRAGAFGGSAHTDTQAANNKALADTLARNTTGIRSAQYNKGADLTESQIARDSANQQNQFTRMLQAAGMAPGFDAQNVANNQAYMQMANQARDVNQQFLDAAQQYFKDMSLAPAQAGDMLLNWMNQLMGMSGSTTQQIAGPSPWATGAGLAALGGSLYNSLG